MTERVEIQEVSRKTRRDLLSIIKKNPGVSTTEITKQYLIKINIVKNEEEFAKMPYNKRVCWLNRLRHHIQKLISLDKIKKKEIGAKRGPFKKAIYEVIGSGKIN